MLNCFLWPESPGSFAPGILYHVIVRGNQRQKTFAKDRDYQVYLEKMAQYRQRYGVTIYAYCLMPNHVHLLLECSGSPLGKFMQGLQQSYTQYYDPHLPQSRPSVSRALPSDFVPERRLFIGAGPLHPPQSGKVQAR